MKAEQVIFKIISTLILLINCILIISIIGIKSYNAQLQSANDLLYNTLLDTQEVIQQHTLNIPEIKKELIRLSNAVDALTLQTERSLDEIKTEYEKAICLPLNQ